MELFKASSQWSTRPADQRFWTLPDMLTATQSHRDSARQSTVSYGAITVKPSGPDLLLVGSSAEATLTHYATGQLCQRAAAPAEYIRSLPTALAAECLNTSLAKRDPTDRAKLLLHQNGTLIARCLTGEGYERIWNSEIVTALCDLPTWRVPPARPAGISGEQTRIATAADCLSDSAKFSLAIKPGDIIAPAGLYASDRDMFAFLIDDAHTITNPLDPSTPLARGFFVWNSEVGDKSFGVTTFLYDAVCGNHIVWGAQNVQEVRIRHTGTARSRASYQLRCSLREYANSSASDTQAQISAAQTFTLGATREQTIDALVSFAARKKISILNRGTFDAAFDLAAQTPRYGNPNTPWAISQAITQTSQQEAYTNRRVALDRAAGKLLEIAF